MTPLDPIPRSNDPADVARFVDERVAAANRKLIMHIDQRFMELRMDVMSAFPDENPTINRQVLEALVEKERYRAQFWRGLQETLAKRGLLVLLAVIASALFLAFKEFVSGI